MSPASETYRVRADGVVSIVIWATDSNWREGLFLVSVTLDAAHGPTSVETMHTTAYGPRSIDWSRTERQSLAGERTLNFVVPAHPDVRKAHVSISGIAGENPFDVRSVEITPIER